MGNSAWRAAHPHQARRIDTRKTLRLKYGISEAQYGEFFEKQSGCCAICGCRIVSQFDDSRPFAGRGTRSDVGYVDHCHLTNAVRGLLCFNCNVSLGKFQDDEKILLKAVRYLRESATAQAQRAA